MLDLSNFMATLQKATDIGQQSQSSLQQNFMQGASSQKLAGADTARQVMSQVSQSCQSMSDQMNNVLKGLQDNVDTHQSEQAAQLPKDFDKAMNDLRSTSSTGFPHELVSFFENLPKAVK